MKKLFTILCAVLITFGLSAQTDQGTFLLEGGSDLNFSSISLSGASFDGEDADDDEMEMLYGEDWDEATSTFGLSLTGGYFIIDGLVAGLIIDYNSSSQGDYKNSSMTIGPVVRYYIGESGVWGQLSYGMGSSKWDDGDDDGDGPKVSSLGIGVGYAVWLSDNIALNPTLAYYMQTHTTEDFLGSGDDYKEKYGGIVFGAGISVHLGN
jgi:hypothetical protein